MDLRLDGKRVLITGASRGIGAELARGFAAEGCNLVLAARSEELLSVIAQEIQTTYSVAVEVRAVDLSVGINIANMVEAIGEIDILVNNAGAIPSGSLAEVDEAQWREGWDLKVHGYINLCRAVYPQMKANGGGVIINNIGNGGEIFDPEYVAGTTGNAALMAFTRALGGVSLNDRIRVLGVNPGPVDTDRIHNMLKKRAHIWLGDEARAHELLERYPLGRPAHLCEITDFILFLASPRAGYASGAIYTIDGGIASRSSII